MWFESGTECCIGLREPCACYFPLLPLVPALYPNLFPCLRAWLLLLCQVCFAAAAVPLQQADVHVAGVQQEQLQSVHNHRGCVAVWWKLLGGGVLSSQGIVGSRSPVALLVWLTMNTTADSQQLPPSLLLPFWCRCCYQLLPCHVSKCQCAC